MELSPIGVLYTPFTEAQNMPIQPTGASDIAGSAEIYPEYREGLQDLDGFSHLILLYHFHLVTEAQLTVTPFLDDQPHGVFATRAPKRPNPIGLSVVRLQRIEGCVLYLLDVDVVNETPLLDIKPYVPEFDHRAATRLGWLGKSRDRVESAKSDSRFL